MLMLLSSVGHCRVYVTVMFVLRLGCVTARCLYSHVYDIVMCVALRCMILSGI